MIIKSRELGVCGLSCRLCPRYHTDAESRCGECKSEQRITVGCTFITCAVKKQSIELCWDCHDNQTCEKWANHRDFGKKHDTFKCYQKLEDNISTILQKGIESFEEQQKTREQLLIETLKEFNEGRSKSYFCIAATILDIDEPMHVPGELVRPANSYVPVKRGAQFDLLIPVRDNFLPEMMTTVGSL